MRTFILALLAASALALAACSDSATDKRATGSTETDANPQIERDPTPDTGTGGDQQGATPEGTSTKPAN